MDTETFSPWGLAATKSLTPDLADIYHKEFRDVTFQLKLAAGSLWIVVTQGKQILAFRTAFSPSGDLELLKSTETKDGVTVLLNAAIGSYKVVITFPENEDFTQLHFQVALKPAGPLKVPFWPKDIIFPEARKADNLPAEIYIRQLGTRSGLIYLGLKQPKGGSVLYFQNLTAINSYFSDTQTSAADTVGSNWPEMGFSLPAAVQPMKARKEYIISDAFVSFNSHLPKDQFEIAEQFINQLAGIYLLLPRPDTKYQPYIDIIKENLHDLQHNKACWCYANGHPYLNAYLCDYATPPEIMVQLAVLTPVMDYNEWSKDGDLLLVEQLLKGLPAFYDEKIGTVMRWLPALEHKLDKSEEQKVPKIMDSWYLHHPLLNLSRLALKGEDSAKKLFMDSLDYAIKVARHFKYEWPVFYNMETLEVIKAETEPGKKGEKDVAGIYAHVMLQAYELTGKKKYLSEAENAAKSLTVYGFDIFYQANNTAFSAGAMHRLWKETGKQLYRKLSQLFLANLFKNMALWSCEYGYGKNFPTFFSLFPLNDAPYIAVYEEQEAVAAVHAYLSTAGEEVTPAFSLLLAEFIRYAQHRLPYYYPPMLPEDMLSEEVKTGEIDPKLWIPLEDIQDGWEKSGSVGQEVYGAGLAFGVVPRNYMRVDHCRILVYLDYPFTKPELKNKSLSFRILGSEKLHCRLRIIADNIERLPEIKFKAHQQEEISPNKETKQYIEYLLQGNQTITINW